MDEETKKTLDLCLKIVKRAQAMGIARGSQMTQMMDLDAANRQFKLRLEEFANADDFGFSHDFCQIQQYMNRETGMIEGVFVPRFAGTN